MSAQLPSIMPALLVLVSPAIRMETLAAAQYRHRQDHHGSV
jgi:hypothetical protein